MNVYSDVPQIISYSGQLSDSGGTPIDTTASLVFNLYEDANNDGVADGSSIWNETHSSVLVDAGLFSVALGSVNTAPGTTLGELKFDVPYLLGINVNGDGEMSLLRLASAPTALRSEDTKGSSVAVDCSTVATGGKIQAALDAGATTVTITGTCEEAVTITRSGVLLTGGGIEGLSNDGNPALTIIGASQVVISAVAITEASGSTDENCVQLVSGANATFSGVTVSSCPDINVSALLNSSINFGGAASTITGGVIGMEVVGGSSANITDVTISGFSEEGLFVGGNSFAFLDGPTIFATASDAVALIIDGSSAVEVDGAYINMTNGNAVNINGSSSLSLFDENGSININGDTTGIFVFTGSVQAEAGIISSNANAIEIHNNSTAIISDSAEVWGGASTGYGVYCTSNAVLNSFNNPTISGADGATNGNGGGSDHCNYSTSFPILDLDADDSSPAIASGFAQTFNESGGDVAIVDTDVSIVDGNGDGLIGHAIVTLTNDQSGDQINVGLMPSGVTAFPLGVAVSLVGTASTTVTDFQTALQAITFNNTGNPGSTIRTIEIKVSDVFDPVQIIQPDFDEYSNTAITTVQTFPGLP
jgi:hypothetical protein